MSLWTASCDDQDLLVRAIEAQLACGLPPTEQGLASADYSGYAELAGADRHVRIGAAELGDESADVTREDPVEAGVRAGTKRIRPAKLSGGSPTEATSAVTLFRVMKLGWLGGR